MNFEKPPNWKYYIPFYGIWLTYKSAEQTKGKLWLVSIVSTVITIFLLNGGKKEKAHDIAVKENEKIEVSQSANSEKSSLDEIILKIKFQKCSCAIKKKKTRDATVSSGIVLIEAKYEDYLMCNAIIRNDSDKKISQGSIISWKNISKTGVEISKNSSTLNEYLPPKIPVNWELEESYDWKKEESADFKKRVAKTECSISDVKIED